MWLFVQGIIAWSIALWTLVILDLTPLCIGQASGDGTSSLGLCVLHSVAAAAVYSPVDLVLLATSAVGAGLLLGSRTRVGDTRVAEDQT